MSPPPHLQHHQPLMAGLSPENYLNSNEENEDAKLKRYFQASCIFKLCDIFQKKYLVTLR